MSITDKQFLATSAGVQSRELNVAGICPRAHLHNNSLAYIHYTLYTIRTIVQEPSEVPLSMSLLRG